MRELNVNEIEQVNGGVFSWGGLFGTMAGGAVTGALAASVVPGAGAGALLGGIGYLTSELYQSVTP